MAAAQSEVNSIDRRSDIKCVPFGSRLLTAANVPFQRATITPRGRQAGRMERREERRKKGGNRGTYFSTHEAVRAAAPPGGGQGFTPSSYLAAAAATASEKWYINTCRTHWGLAAS